MFGSYLQLGFEHILDSTGYDHILFVVALTSLYLVRDWKKVLILVTAFTIGHSLTLALASLNLIRVNSDVVEILIPITIMLTCVFNIISWKTDRVSIRWQYILALGFGLIHGLGFSTYFKAILGKEESIVWPLLAFNSGVELGQLIIVSMVLLISWIFVDLLKLHRRQWVFSISVIVLLWSSWLLYLLLNK